MARMLLSDLDKARRFMSKLQSDYSYACKTILKIRSKDGRLIPLEPYPMQEKFLKDFSQYRYAVKPRQVGFSTIIIAENFLDILFKPHLYIVTVVPDEEAAEYLFKILHRFYSNLPPELQRKTKYSTKKMIEFEDWDSVYAIQPAGKKNIGRSYTWNKVHITEVDHIENFSEIYLPIEDSVDKKTGRFIFETTPNGVGSVMHKMIKKMKAGLINGSYHFISWKQHAEYCNGTPGGEAGKDGLTPGQREFKNDKVQSYVRSGMSFNDALNYFSQEYPDNDIDCWIVSGGSIFDKSRLRNDIDRAKPGIRGDLLEFVDNGIKGFKFIPNPEGYLEIWKFPDNGWRYKYVLGGDVAEGIEVARGINERDYSVLQVIDNVTLEQVAIWHGRIDPSVLAQVAINLAKFYDNAFMCIESNMDGATTNREILDLGYSNVYHRRITNQDYDFESVTVGFKTHRGTRPLIVNELLELYNTGTESKMKINDVRTLEEMHSFVKDSKGVPRGTSGAHDDRVMALAMAFEARKEAPLPEEKKEERIIYQPASNDGEIYKNMNFNYSSKYMN